MQKKAGLGIRLSGEYEMCCRKFPTIAKARSYSKGLQELNKIVYLQPLVEQDKQSINVYKYINNIIYSFYY